MSMGGSACISGSYTTDVVRTGYEVKHGVRRDIKDEVISKGTFKLGNVAGDIHFDLGFFTRGYVGIEVGAGALACTLGVNFDCSFSGNFTMINIDDEIDLSKLLNQMHKTPVKKRRCPGSYQTFWHELL